MVMHALYTHDLWAQVVTLAAAQQTPSKPQLSLDEFSRLYAAAYQTLVVVAMSQTGRANAEDVVQQAAMIAWESRSRFKVGTDFRAWMVAIVRGAARNDRRSEGRRTKRHQALAHEPGHAVVGFIDGGPGPGPIDPQLERAMDHLNETQRECFLLRVLLGRTYDQIASITGLPAATARTHVARARQQLAAALASSRGAASHA